MEAGVCYLVVLEVYWLIQGGLDYVCLLWIHLDIQFSKERQPDGGHKANCCLENSLVGSGGGTGNFHEVWQFC